MKKQIKKDQEINYRLHEPYDKLSIISLMQELKVPIGGCYNHDIYKSFYNFSKKNKDVIIVVADYGKLLVGLSITIIDWKKFWREFCKKNIFVFFKIVIKKIKTAWNYNINKSKKLSNEKSNDISMYLSNKKTDRSWNDSSPLIAKVLYVAVKKDYRKHGIGKGLYDFRMQVLKERGVKRLDSKINRQNIAPIKLAFNEGRLIIHDKKGMLFTTLDI